MVSKLVSFCEDLVVWSFSCWSFIFYRIGEGNVFILDVVNISVESWKHLIRCQLETCFCALPC